MIVERQPHTPELKTALSLQEQRACYNCLHGFTHYQEGFRFRHNDHWGLSLTPGFTGYLKDISGLRGDRQIQEVLLPALGRATLEDGLIPELVFPAAHVEDIMVLLMKAHHLDGMDRGIFPLSNPNKKYKEIRGHSLSEKGLLEVYSFLSDSNGILPILGASIEAKERKSIDAYANRINDAHLFNPSVYNVLMEGRGLPRKHSVASLALLLHRIMQLRFQQRYGKQAHFDFAFS